MTIIIKTNASANIEDSVVELDARLFFQRLRENFSERSL